MSTVTILAVLTVLALSSCDTIPSRQHLGVEPIPDHQTVQVRYVGCPGERVLTVSIVRPDRKPALVLWEIHSRGGGSQTAFEVGKPPPGFSTATALASPLPPRLHLVAIVHTTTFADVIAGFEVSRLREGLVYTGDEKYLSEESFDQRARERCR